jgi:hypothetical protein
MVTRVFVWLAVGFLIVLAAGDAAGRWRLVPAPPHTAGTKYSRSDLVVVVPVPVQRLQVGDVVIIRNKHEHALLRLEKIVDSDGPQVRFAADPPGRIRKLDGTAWRVRTAVPFVGGVLGLLAGPIQGGLLVLVGFALIVRAEVRRAREAAPAQPAPSGSGAT